MKIVGKASDIAEEVEETNGINTFGVCQIVFSIGFVVGIFVAIIIWNFLWVI